MWGDLVWEEGLLPTVCPWGWGWHPEKVGQWLQEAREQLRAGGQLRHPRGWPGGASRGL